VTIYEVVEFIIKEVALIDIKLIKDIAIARVFVTDTYPPPE
jgi:hypothetical protein